MRFMFTACDSFNQPLDNWDVSNVRYTDSMFHGCTSFNQPLDNWNVSNVRYTDSMFNGCTSFNQPLDSWDVHNVTNMGLMFKNCQAFNQPLDSWDVHKVTNMGMMFYNCQAFNQPLDSWNVSNVKDMSKMFQNCQAFNQPLNSWNVSNVTDMDWMFQNCQAFDQPLNSWNVSNVRSMGWMFQNCQAFNQSLRSWKLPVGAFADDILKNTPLQGDADKLPGTLLTEEQEKLKATVTQQMEDFKQNPNKRPRKEDLNEVPVCPVCRDPLVNKPESSKPSESTDNDEPSKPSESTDNDVKLDTDVIYVCVKNHLMHRGCAKDCAILRNTDGEYSTKLHYSGKCPVCKQALIPDLDNQNKVPEKEILENHHKTGGRLRRKKCTRQTKRQRLTKRRVRKHKRAAYTRKRRY